MKNEARLQSNSRIQFKIKIQASIYFKLERTQKKPMKRTMARTIQGKTKRGGQIRPKDAQPAGPTKREAISLMTL